MKGFAFLAVMLTLAGCVTAHKSPETELSSDCGSPDACWAKVLKTHVNTKGQVDFAAAKADIGPLNTYVRYIAKVSPASHPDQFASQESKMAYYLNSYNALAMWGVIQNGIPKAFDSFFKRLSFFKLNEYEIGGTYISLYDYENDIIRKQGDPRIHFALNCMSVGCPRLPQEPFPVSGLDKILDYASVEFFNSPTYLRIDHGTKTVHISEILDFFTGDFVGPGKEENLIAYVNKYSTEKAPESYKVQFIPYDWTVNRQ